MLQFAYATSSLTAFFRFVVLSFVFCFAFAFLSLELTILGCVVTECISWRKIDNNKQLIAIVCKSGLFYVAASDLFS